MIMNLGVILCLGVALAATQICPTYVCNPEGFQWPDGYCALFNGVNSTQYNIRPDYCPSGQICPYGPLGNVMCMVLPAPLPPVVIAFPGEACNMMNLCIAGVCVYGVCQTKNEGDACSSVYECGGSLTCPQQGPNVGKCTPLIPVNEMGCYQHSDCVQNAGCVARVVGNVCIAYSSILPQQIVPSCTSETTALALSPYCQSGYCYTPTTGANSLCADFVASSAKVPTTCTDDSDCLSVSDSGAKTNTKSSCQCSLDGNYYCSLHPGDPLMATYLANQRTYLESASLLQCNSWRNLGWPPSFLGDYCSRTTANPSQEWLFSYYRATLYALVVNTETCVVEALFPEYYQVEMKENWVVGIVKGFLG